MEEFKGAKIQLEKEIREAIVFLRTKNQTIPSETIEFMKVASLEKLHKKSVWISVKERLPKINTDVTFSNPNDGWVSTGFIGNDLRWYDVHDQSGCECYPTHWCPLPEMPE